MKKEEIRRIMKDTCFGSISFCCGLEKECEFRDKVLKKLGLTKGDFLMLKKYMDDILFKILKRR